MSIVLNGTGGTISGVPGQVLQVVTSVSGSIFSTTSSSLTSTGHSVSITPSSSSSKILIISNSIVSSSGMNGWGAFATVYRGATNLAAAYGTGGNNSFAAMYSTTSMNLTIPFSMTFLDSPATTSSTTYTVYVGGGGATVKYCSDSWYAGTPPAVLTAIEIAA